MSKPVSRLDYVQVLRFLAAGSVLVGHLEHEAAGIRPVSWMNWGAGVDVFFVISGFIMYLLSADRFGKPGTARQFFERRLQRIAPTYWLFTTLMVVATLLFAGQIDHTQLNPAHVAASYLFAPWPNEFGKLQPLLGVGWTLNYEMLFYVIFSVALLLPAKRGLLALLATFAALIGLGVVAPDAAWPLKFWGNPIILEFLYGISLAALFLRGVRLGGVAAVGLGVSGFALLAALHVAGLSVQPWRFIGAGIPALLIASAFALAPAPKRSGKFLAFLVLAGDASYALYLSHAFTINAYKLVWNKLGLHHPWLYVATGALVSVLASLAIYVVLERPLMDWLRRRPIKAQLTQADVRASL